MSTKSLGKVFMTPRGIWSKTNYYQTLDVVMVREATACKGYIATDNIEANIAITDSRWKELFIVNDGEATADFNNKVKQVDTNTKSVDANKKAIDIIYEQLKTLSGVEIIKNQPTNAKTAVWINPNEKDIITIPEVNDSLVNTVDTWSSKKISDILTKSTNNIAQMQNTVDALKTIEVRSTEPTATGTEMWVNPESQDVITIPEINDALTNKTDTWSSAKISEEVASASKSASADVSSVATMKASVEDTVADFNTSATKANKTLTDTGTAQKNEVTDEGSKQVSAVKSAASEILKINGVEISDTTPTNTKTAVWINPKEKSSTTLPEVNDSAVNTSDTWSSKKINDELQKLITRISALESK